VAARLEPWFEANARELPWRETRDLYAIWISEVMLQQTRVETVLAYYEPFLQRFPTLESLAAAEQDEVLEAWSGLGYYRRARFLHRGARFVVDELGGQFPDGAKALQAIPGIGPYTAGALASIGQDRPDPLVDGNVARVSSRLRAVEVPSEQDAKHAGHWTFAREVLEGGRPRVLAQALMELGATVCTPRSPKCTECPLTRQCRAKASGLETVIPAPKKKKASPETHYWALALQRRGRLYLRKRPAEGLLAGMWCLPLIERRPKARKLSQLSLRDASEQLGLSPGVLGETRPLGGEPVKHVFTHRVWWLYPGVLELEGALAKSTPGEWSSIRPGERPKGGVPSVTNRVLEALGY
jgi:A/G-specific adenine glycosylase